MESSIQQPEDSRHPERPAEELLPALRMDLDFQPSPAPDQPGLLIRDSYHYSDTTLIVPPYLLRFLPFFDGRHRRDELLAELEKVTSKPNARQLESHLRETLEGAGFVLGHRFERMRSDALEAFARSSVRMASHAGAAYPGEPGELRDYLRENLNGLRENLNGHRKAQEPQGAQFAVAAPHISFEGGWHSYAAMAEQVQHADPSSLFVVMGTSHYGEPGKFGVTAKPFRTPLGETAPAPEFVHSLVEACPNVTVAEDYAHAIDHSVEFHVVLLQYLLRPDVTVVPLLVGAFLDPMQNGGVPEDSALLREAFATLRALADRQKRKVYWLLSVDMAHMGKRYGDDFEAVATQGRMSEVQEMDHARIDMLQRGDSTALWQHVNRHDSDLKWCGSSTLYTFLRVYPEARASLLSYQQWNIDPASVVSFGSLGFRR